MSNTTKPIAIFYGSSTGSTKEAAGEIALELGKYTTVPIEQIDVYKMKPERLLEYECFLIGCPTWDVGELQGDWDCIHRKLGTLRFEGKTIALFGCGDSVSYSDTFQDALGILGREFRKRGAALVGKWPTEGYEFDGSLGVEDGCFLGLALDYDNYAKNCKGQIEGWVAQLAQEFSLSPHP